MIGTMEHANTAASFEGMDFDSEDENTCDCTCCNEDRENYGFNNVNELPDGWIFIGGGCSRNAFLGPDGVVYKVLTRDGEGDMYDGDPETGHYSYDRANVQEWVNFVSLTPKLAGMQVRLAECYLWTRAVLAMEYVDGRSPFYSEFTAERAAVKFLSHNSIIDIHGANCFVVEEKDGMSTKNVLVLIDYAW